MMMMMMMMMIITIIIIIIIIRQFIPRKFAKAANAHLVDCYEKDRF